MFCYFFSARSWLKKNALLKIRTDYNYFTENNNRGNTYQIPDSQSDLDTHCPTLVYTKNIFGVHWKRELLCFYLQALYAVIFLALSPEASQLYQHCWAQQWSLTWNDSSAVPPQHEWQSIARQSQSNRLEGGKCEIKLMRLRRKLNLGL